MRISVLINSYNYGRYLNQCIDSVLNQDFDNTEIIVFDDGSVDASKAILKSYGNKIIAFEGENSGLKSSFSQANAINRAFQESSGELICLLDADDMFAPGKLKALNQIFSANSSIQCLQHGLSEVNSGGIPTGVCKVRIHENHDVLKWIYRMQTPMANFAPTSGLSFRREFLQQLLPLPLSDSFSLIWPDVRLRLNALLKNGKLHSCARPLGLYRNHGTNDSVLLTQCREKEMAFRRQHFEYFNSTAIAHGRATISIDRCLYQNFNSPLGITRFFVFRANNFQRANMLKRLLRTIFRR